jgi:rod shape-determining protein MreB
MTIINLIDKLKRAVMSRVRNWRPVIGDYLAIDLGSSNTRIYAAGQGIVLDEPSVIAYDDNMDRLIAAGRAAKIMSWREPLCVNIVRPIREGVIADVDAASQMIASFLDRIPVTRSLFGPHILVCVSGDISAVERRTFEALAGNAGARRVDLIEESFAAAVAMRSIQHSEHASMVLDIGGGTVDVAVFSSSGLIRTATLRGGGNEVDQALIHYLRTKCERELGAWTAEDAKIRFSSIKAPLSQIRLTARNFATGLPETVLVTREQFNEAIEPVIIKIVRHVRLVIEELPTQIAADVFDTGIILTGGGAHLAGLSERLADELKLKIWVAPDPMSIVVRGAGCVIEQAGESTVLGADQMPLLFNLNGNNRSGYLLSSELMAESTGQRKDEDIANQPSIYEEYQRSLTGADHRQQRSSGRTDD